MVGGEVHRELDLRGEVVTAGGVAVAEVADQADQVGHDPFERRLREAATTTSTRPRPASAMRASAAATTSAATRGWTMASPRSTEITARLPGRSKDAETRLPPLDPGQAQGVAGVEAVADVEPPGRVADRAAEAPEGHGQRRLQGAGATGDATVGGLEPEHAGEPGRDPDRPAAVAAGGHGRVRRPPRRPCPRGTARGAFGVPGVAGRPVEPGVGVVDAAELAGRGLAGEHRAGRSQAGDQGRVVVATRSAKTSEASV